jgi:general secretion pathway protein E
MVGETRDQETAEMAINASLTGHFVLSTLHTNDSSSAPTRLIDMGVQPFLISSSLVAILSQRLMRELCKECKIEHTPTEYEMQLLELNSIPEDATIYAQQGCQKCSDTGYSGRTAINELLLINDEVRGLILERADASTIKKAALRNGMITLWNDALHKVFLGKSSIEEMLRVGNAEETEEELEG